MEKRIFDYWVSTLQDGYLGNLVSIVENAGGPQNLYEMSDEQLRKTEKVTDKIAAYITERRIDINVIEKEYNDLKSNGICYVNLFDGYFPEKLRNIPSPPYGLFVKGTLPDPSKPSVAIVGARECSEYGRLMAEYLGSRLAKAGIQIISGMAWGIDGISQTAALSSGGKSYAVLGCGVDIPYPRKNKVLYNNLCVDGNGVISEYAPGTPAIARQFPPRNRIIAGLCDILIVVEARKRSGTLITVDMAIDQGKTVMVVPGRLTDDLSVGCLNLIAQGALPITGIESVLEQIEEPGQPTVRSDSYGNGRKITKIHPREKISTNAHSGPIFKGDPELPEDLQTVASELTLDPQSAETIANKSDISLETALIMLTKLELTGYARETWPGYFVKNVVIS